MKWICLICLVFSMLAFSMAGYGDQDSHAASVMVYTSIYPDAIESARPMMRASLPDIHIEWFQGGSEIIMAKIAGELAAQRLQPDLLMISDPAYYYLLREKGLLLPCISGRNGAFYLDPAGYWTGVRVSNMILAYNSDQVSQAEAPRRFSDLTAPKWHGRIAMPNPLLSGTAFVTAGTLSQVYGWEYFDRLKANGLKVEPGSSAIQNKLIRGEYQAAIILEENVLKVMAQGEPVKAVYPEDGIVMIPGPAAILSTSRNPDAARQVLGWWLSDEGQAAIARGWMHPARDDISPPRGAPPLRTFAGRAFPVDWQRLMRDSDRIKEAFRARVLEK